MDHGSAQPLFSEEIRQIARKAKGNGGTAIIPFDRLELGCLLHDGLMAEANLGRTSLEVVLPNHPLYEPRDSRVLTLAILTSENRGIIMEELRGEGWPDSNVREVCEAIDGWREVIVDFAIEAGCKAVVISAPQVCGSCKGFPDVRSNCKVCGGKMPRKPTLANGETYRKWHTMSIIC